jgi:hypothetical protein
MIPIALFVYNRPNHTRAVLNSLSKNKESKDSVLYFFCDGPKINAVENDFILINQTRELIRNETRFKDVKIILNDKNKGLAESIIDGVDFVLSTNDKVIVLEDDIVPEIGFLKFMNEALNLYESTNEIGCVHAWNYSFVNNRIKESTFLLKGADCWGWGTWKRAWDLFERDGQKLKNELDNKNLIDSFNRNNTHAFYNMLIDQIDRKNNSWAIRWHASLFLANKYCLHPTYPIVKNIGLDGSGTHCDVEDFIQLTTKNIKLTKHTEFKENIDFFNSFNQGVKTKLTRWEKLKHFLK